MSRGLKFVIDKITNSLEEVATGISYATDVRPVISSEINLIHKKDGWLFNWKREFKLPERQVYKLVLKNSDRIQGLISAVPMSGERYVEMHLIENAPHNFGTHKQFAGVATNLVAFICKLSFIKGFEGMVAFRAKTDLVDYYINALGAQSIFGRERMAIFEPTSKKLVNSYYKNFFNDH